jgi:cytochrome c-type biogenesis protein CcmH
MSGRRLLLVAALLLGLSAGGAAAGEARPTLAELEAEIICPTCHTTLDQSSAPIAERMRRFIRARIAAGDTKSEIKRKLVAQFGEQVLAAPPKRGFDLLVWILPPVSVACGAAALGLLARRWSRRRSPAGGGAPDALPLDPASEALVDEELRRLEA